MENTPTTISAYSNDLKQDSETKLHLYLSIVVVVIFIFELDFFSFVGSLLIYQRNNFATNLGADLITLSSLTIFSAQHNRQLIIFNLKDQYKIKKLF